jgi:Leucine-rich repeat (LRR) protein
MTLTNTTLTRTFLKNSTYFFFQNHFFQLRNLRHLDLYSNRLDKLPVSFASLKNLKWLDLKNNPLVPALQQAAGPCITATDCAMCAKKVKTSFLKHKKPKTSFILIY